MEHAGKYIYYKKNTPTNTHTKTTHTHTLTHARTHTRTRAHTHASVQRIKLLFDIQVTMHHDKFL